MLNGVREQYITDDQVNIFYGLKFYSLNVSNVISSFRENIHVTKLCKAMVWDSNVALFVYEQLDDRMEKLTQKLRQDIERNVDANLEEQVDTSLSEKIEDLLENSVRKKISELGSNSFYKDEVEKIVQDGLAAYDADKIGENYSL